MRCLIFLSYAQDNPEKTGHCIFSAGFPKSTSQGKTIITRLSKTRHFMAEVELQKDSGFFMGTGTDEYGKFYIEGQKIGIALHITKTTSAEESVWGKGPVNYHLENSLGNGWFGTYDLTNQEKVGWAYLVIIPCEEASRTGLEY